MTAPAGRRTILVLSQTYVPDPASVGQHVADAALELARRGHRVVVLTSRRGYDDPSVRYLPREIRGGVEIVRLPLSSFGKRTLAHRVIGGLSFVVQAAARGLLTRRLAGVLVSTSPPTASLAALKIGILRRVPIAYWVMDVNPDQAIAMGQVGPRSLPARLLEALNRLVLRRARAVIALDRFMAGRLAAKAGSAGLGSRLAVIPPWPHEDHLEPVPHASNPFRARHGFGDRFVIAYSGNHSPASPLTTILQAALLLRDEPRLLFAFIGGGLGKREVEAVIERHRPGNVVSLPYQPLADLRFSLSAADVHLVTMGDGMAGIIHPCKVYGAMAVARPVLFVGPAPSHLSELVDRLGIGWRVAHGDVDGAVATIRRLLAADPADLAAMGARGRQAIGDELGKALLCGRTCDAIERALVGERESGSPGGAPRGAPPAAVSAGR